MKKFVSVNLIVGLVLAGILSRLIPHAPNFTAVGATALFAGALIRPRWMSFVIPLVILWLSDLYLNNGMYRNMFPEKYTGWQWMGSAWVYIGFVMIVALGQLGIRTIRVKNVLISSILASLFFFLITNFGVWLYNPAWPQNPAGLIACYEFALPYFWNTIAADLLFSGVLFGTYVWVKGRYRRLEVRGER